MRKRLSVFLALTVLIVFDASAQNTLVPFGSLWQYLDNGVNQGTAWKSPSFNSNEWKTGVGKFGYGIGDASTIVGYGPSTKAKYITTYFRKTITLSDPSALGSFSANIRLDDGAVIYVNGVEVYRLNMPTGVIAYNTLAAEGASGDGSKTLTFNLNAASFVSGTNVVAVEVHQSKANTSDMAFDLQLNSTQFGSDEDTVAPHVLHITRHSPSTATIEPSAATFRAVFSEPVNGVSSEDFTPMATGSAVGTVTAVESLDGSTYDITVNITGEGTLRLDLKSSDTGITDLSANPISGGYSSGESYTIDLPDPPANGLFAFGSSWKYLDNGSDQGTAWRSISLNDGAWKTGNGKFGYGISDASTLINYGSNASNKYVTTYFRKAISLTDPANYSTITANIKMDDGVVVYVNGAEVYRMNMPTGTIAHNTFSATSSSDDGTIVQTFTIDKNAFISGTNLIAVEVHQSNPDTPDMAFDLQLTSSPSDSEPPADTTPPQVNSIVRYSPTNPDIQAGPVTFRVTFSESVNGVSADDFSFMYSGSASGTVTGLAPVSSAGSQYDVDVNAAGIGSLRLELRASGTGITDTASNTIASGFTSGESYNLQEAPSTGVSGFASVTNLTPISISTNTAEKPQSKVWTYAGKFWTILPTSDGIFLWRLDGTAWTRMLRVSSGTKARADCKVVGNVMHALLFRGADNTSYLVSLEYNTSLGTYQFWGPRTTRVPIEFEDGTETATLDIDGNGRMWVASDDSGGNVNVRWADSPYSDWNAPIAVASGTMSDDLAGIIAMPGKIGVLWSDQNAKRFGFKTHTDGADPAFWSADENPAAGSALDMGSGMGDDHLNIAIAGDGTLYCAVKTGYDEPGYTKLALLVRRPTGTWDPLYEVTEFQGTRPIALLNESKGRIRVVYTSNENGGDLLYSESSLGPISFGSPITLLSGMYNYASSTKDQYTGETVIIATDVSSTALKAVGFLISDVAPSASSLASNAVSESKTYTDGTRAFPNPFTTTATVSFSVDQDSEFFAELIDSRGTRVRSLGKGKAGKDTTVSLEIDGTDLAAGLYFVKMTTDYNTKTIRLVRDPN